MNIIYFIGVWLHLLTKNISSKLKRAVRIISFERNDSPSAPLFKNLNILSLTFAIKNKHAKFILKLFNHELASSSSSMFYFNPRTIIYHHMIHDSYIQGYLWMTMYYSKDLWFGMRFLMKSRRRDLLILFRKSDKLLS